MQGEEQKIEKYQTDFYFEGLGPITWVDLGGGAKAKINFFGIWSCCISN